MAGGQQHGFAADFAAEFAEGNDRAGEGDRADQNAQVDFDFMNSFFRPGQRGCSIHEAGIADQHRRDTDETVHDRDQFRHLGHFHFERGARTDQTADYQRNDQNTVSRKGRVQYRRQNGDRHPDHTVIVPAP